MNMFKKNTSASVTEYITAVPEERKKTIEFFHSFIQKTAPTLKPHYAYNMLGYGTMKYKNYKNEVIDWPVIAMANQKNYVSIYVCAVLNGEYIAEKFKTELGKVSVGKSCIRFKKIEDINLDVLKKVIRLAEKNPGLLGAKDHKKSSQ